MRDPKLRQLLHDRTVAVLVSELLFVLLPFLVMLIVLMHKDTPLLTLLNAPEWAFASTILFGQALVKFVSGMFEAGPARHSENMGLAVTVLIVLGLVPSMVLLTLALLNTTPAIWMAVALIAVFILSVATFLFVGGSGQLAAFEAREAQIRNRR